MNAPVNFDYDDFISQIKTNSSVIVIDVRTPEEYEVFHFEDSLLCDIYNPNFVNEILSLDRGKEYYVYCLSGSRSFQAGLFMLQNGFEKVYNLKNGIKNLLTF
jgi:rhodanese-related sulfurtransferase